MMRQQSSHDANLNLAVFAMLVLLVSMLFIGMLLFVGEVGSSVIRLGSIVPAGNSGGHSGIDDCSIVFL